MAWIEDITKRTQKAKHFYDASTNQWRAEFTVHDQHYHDGNSWQDVDENLITDGGVLSFQIKYGYRCLVHTFVGKDFSSGQSKHLITLGSISE